MEELMICISGGHNATKTGANSQGFSEYPETFLWAECICWELEALGVTAHLVSTGGLRHKVDEINELGASMAVEIHFNADPMHMGKGCETLYHPNSRKGLCLANEIQRQMSPFFAPNRGVKEGWYKMDRPGAVDYRGDVDGDELVDYFLRSTRCPAVIVEPEFIHNRSVIEANREIGSQVIAEAIKAVHDEWRV
jgi:N-acetylmuramoyl-L-alanine amidase